MNNSQLKRKYKIIKSINIKSSKEKAWDVLSDFNNVYTWAPGVEESYGLTDLNQQVGAGRHCKLDGFGEIDEYVIEWNEGSGFVYDVTPLGPLTNAISRWSLESHGQTTKLVVDFNYDIRFGIIGRIMHKLVMRKKLENSLPDTLISLKKRIESGKLVRPYLIKTART
jgi:hypothetical protein